MTFYNPDILYLLLLIPALIFMFIQGERRRRTAVSAMTGERPGAVMGAGFERRLAFLFFLCLGVGMLVAAAARPQWGSRMEEARARGIDMLVAIDLSESMNAPDVTPSRMARARQSVYKFLDILEGDRVGLVGFAGSAFAFVPLTVDYGAVRLFLDSMEPGTIEDAGTDISTAITEAVAQFERSKSDASKVLVIFSDGEHHEEPWGQAVEQALDADIRIFTIGIGNAESDGARIPVGEKDGEVVYKLDQSKNLVITRLDENTLIEIARTGGGDYYRVSESGNELASIYRALEEEREAEFTSRSMRLKEDRFQIPLLIALILLTVAYSLGARSFKKLRRTQGVRT